MLEIIVGFVTVITILFYYYLTQNFNYWRDKGVVYVKAYPLIGSIPKVVTLLEHLSEFHSRIYKQYADIPFIGYYQVRTPILLIRDPELIKEILVKDFSHFTDRGFELNEENDPLQARNMFNMGGQKWKEMRSKLTPTFTSGRIKAMCPLVTECADKLGQYLDTFADSGIDINIKDILARYTTDVIGKCAFGVQCDSINNPNDIFRRMGRRIFEPTLLEAKNLPLTLLAPEFAKLFNITLLPKDVDNFFRKTVREVMALRAQNPGKNYKDFMQLLIEIKEKGCLSDEHDNEAENKPTTTNMTDSNNAKNFTDDDITAQALVFFVGGFETSSSALTYAFMELARRPDLQRTARRHIEEVLQRHDGQVTYQALQEMTYLDWILQESLRKYPILPFLNRKCNKNYIIPGTNITLEKGQAIAVPLLSLQNDPKYFPNPEIFEPERFNKDNGNIKAFTFLPFGEGPRQCIGLRFAKVQSKLGLLAILRKFEVQPSSKTKYPISPDSTQFLLVSKDDIFVKLSRV